MTTTLFADRFLVRESGPAIDLASGRAATIRRVPVRDRAAAHAWLQRCTVLSGLTHPGLVRLVDFGPAGRGGYFEALDCPSERPWTAGDAEAAGVVLDVAGFLHARRLSFGSMTGARVTEVDGRLRVVPDERTGAELTEQALVGEVRALADMSAARNCRAAARPTERSSAGGQVMSAEEVELVGQVAEMLETGLPGRPRAIELRVSGADRDHLRTVLARAARVRGYVPVSPGELRSGVLGTGWMAAVAQAVQGRHAVLLHDGRGPLDPATSCLFLSLAAESERPHMLLVLGAARETAVPSVVGASFDAFRLREQSAPYLVGSPPAGGPGRTPVAGAGYGRPAGTLAPAETARAQSKVEGALQLADRGRHQAAARSLREAIGWLERRGGSIEAGHANLALGRLLLGRGQAVAAAEVFDRARRQLSAGAHLASSAAAAVCQGLAWTDAGRWSEAESVIRAARICALGRSDAGVTAFAAIALARALFWQGRFDEALAALPSTDEMTGRLCGHGRRDLAGSFLERRPLAVHDAHLGGEPWSIGGDEAEAGDLAGVPDLIVSREALAARIHLAADDLRAAGGAASRGRDAALRAGRPAEIAIAAMAAASVYSSMGDLAALRREVALGIQAAGTCHEPLRRLRMRILLAEGLLRAGREPEARSLAGRLSRLERAALPVVVRRRIEDLQHVVARFGTRPRGTSVPVAPARTIAASARPDAVAAVIDVLALCQAVEDEEVLARRIVGTLRARVRAAALGCYGVVEGRTMTLAQDGGTLPPIEVVRRTIDAGFAIAPGASASKLDASVPIRLAGRVIGALGCRWPADDPPDWERVRGLLEAAGCALAPALGSVLDRRTVPAEPPADGADEIVGVSQPVLALRAEIARAARAPFNVVIEGESGSGKELVARAVHRLGPRGRRRLCAVNCAALTDELLEAELFGHARGAFTGAIAERKGLFEEADGGSLILDEVGELTPRAQAKLLRAIQEGEVRRVGENIARTVDVRIIAASNRPLRAAADGGSFRRDLLYRLDVIRIAVPALRERVEDIPILAHHFWGRATSRVGSRATLAPSTLAALARYDWPGNVRELQNVLSALAVDAGTRGSVGPDRLPAIIAREASSERTSTLETARRLFEVRFVRAALARAGGQRSRAARDLGLTRQGLAKLLARLDIDAVTLEPVRDREGSPAPGQAPVAS